MRRYSVFHYPGPPCLVVYIPSHAVLITAFLSIVAPVLLTSFEGGFQPVNKTCSSP
uniref:Uncharacterized protein n=1 Tax=Utricularia reniformis TaxID=192314 RepID=A0A1Y0AZN6_9LAMI|nr:hypothetical protein AEK19_MT0330 [Utricularia reniformis]ART30603.1 hypothetical protein AEK19_MT0330 [Utricularia reniformis]